MVRPWEMVVTDVEGQEVFRRPMPAAMGRYASQRGWQKTFYYQWTVRCSDDQGNPRLLRTGFASSAKVADIFWDSVVNR